MIQVNFFHPEFGFISSSIRPEELEELIQQGYQLVEE